MNWFRSKKTEPAKPEVPVASNSQPAPQPVARELRYISGLGQPSYEGLDELFYSPTAPDQELTPLVIIGVGSFGAVVVEKFSVMMQAVGQPVKDPVRLVSIQLDGEPESDYEILDPDKKYGAQSHVEYLNLEIARSTSLFDWYKADSNWVRSDGRLAFFQSLNKKPAHLWDVLQKVLVRNNPQQTPAVWIIGTSFGPSSGLILDLAHLVRLISARQQYVPDIGLMLALPGQGWAFTHFAESAAMLREMERLLQLNVERKYEDYSSHSDNPDLLKAVMRSDNDVNSVFLCEPDANLYGKPAVEKIISEMAHGLVVFSNPACWQGDGGIKKFLGSNIKNVHENEEVCVSGFGISAHIVPLAELKKLVRGRLAKDILLDRTQGIIKAWSQDEVEFSEEDVKNFLRGCEHPVLETLGTVKSSFDFPRSWPASTQVDVFLAEALRKKFQFYLDENSTTIGLSSCYALIQAILDYIERMGFPATVVNEEQVMPVLQNALTELNAWQGGCKASREFVEQEIRAADNNWQEVLESGAGEGYDFDAMFKAMLGAIKKFDEQRSLSTHIREHIRSAWVRHDEKLELRLHVLGPGWKPASYVSIPPANFASSLLWNNVTAVITAMTQDEILWPNSLSLVAANQIEDQSSGTASVSLEYDPGKFPANIIQSKLGLVVSGDADWINQRWLDAASNPQKLNTFAGTAGFLMKIHQPIPLSSIKSILGSRENYVRSRKDGYAVHALRPEQIAAKLETLSVSMLSLVEQRKLPYQGLMHATVTLLEDYERVELFVQAWWAGFIRNGKAKDETCIFQGKNTVVWQTGGSTHLLDVLARFVTQDPDNFESVKAKINLVIPVEPDKKNINQIDQWWSHADHKDFDWYILATGILGKRR